jgi:hypothetical protein
MPCHYILVSRVERERETTMKRFVISHTVGFECKREGMGFWFFCEGRDMNDNRTQHSGLFNHLHVYATRKVADSAPRNHKALLADCDFSQATMSDNTREMLKTLGAL